MRIFKSHPLLKLVNSYIIDAPQPSNISYLWNFGVRRARALIKGVCPNSIVYSSVKEETLYKLRMTTGYIVNMYIAWVAGHNCLERKGLPPLAVKTSRCSYAEVNQLDTQLRHLFRNCILSRICRYICGIACYNNQSMICWWGATRKPSIGNKRTEQAAKATWTLNGINSQPRDLIAYDRLSSSAVSIMRKRSFHSSSLVFRTSKLVQTPAYPKAGFASSPISPPKFWGG